MAVFGPSGGHASDEAVAVEDGHIALDAVVGAGVDGDGPGEALGGSYGDDLGTPLMPYCPAPARSEHLVELLEVACGPLALVAAEELRLEGRVLRLQAGEPVVPVAGVADRGDRVADRVDRGGDPVLDRTEDVGRGSQGTVDR